MRSTCVVITHTHDISFHRETFRLSLSFHRHSVNTAHTTFRYVVKGPIIQSVAIVRVPAPLPWCRRRER